MDCQGTGDERSKAYSATPGSGDCDGRTDRGMRQLRYAGAWLNQVPAFHREARPKVTGGRLFSGATAAASQPTHDHHQKKKKRKKKTGFKKSSLHPCDDVAAKDKQEEFK